MPCSSAKFRKYPEHSDGYIGNMSLLCSFLIVIGSQAPPLRLQAIDPIRCPSSPTLRHIFSKNIIRRHNGMPRSPRVLHKFRCWRNKRKPHKMCLHACNETKEKNMGSRSTIPLNPRESTCMW